MNILAAARNLLRAHGGSCSVEENSRLGAAFRLMEQTGEVDIFKSGTEGYVDVYDKNFKPVFNGER